MAKRRASDHRIPSAPVAAIFGWLMPGLGHWWIGERARAVILFLLVSITFWGGVAVGGVRSVVSERENGPWIAAQLCMGPQALVALTASRQLRRNEASGVSPSYKAPWPSGEIGVIYAGVAGLLNLLAILDVLARVELRHASRSGRTRTAGKRVEAAS